MQEPVNVPSPSVAPHDVALNASWTTAGGEGPLAGQDGVDCTSQPGTCIVTGHETIQPAASSVLQGTFLDTGHYHASPDGSLRGNGTWVFTGSIDGCAGAGTITWAYALYLSPVPVVRTDGYVLHGWDNMTTLLGYTGFKHIVDRRPADAGPIFSAEYWLNPQAAGVGTVAGAISCE